MSKHRSNIDHSQNPSDKVQDISMEHFEKNTGRKVDHETLNRHSRADVLDRNTKNRARDSI